MCGIVGLHLKNPDLHDRLGALLTPMLAALTSRGPDSAGVALYAEGTPAGSLRYSLRAPDQDGPDQAGGFDWAELAAKFGAAAGAEVGLTRRGDAQKADVHEAGIHPASVQKANVHPAKAQKADLHESNVAVLTAPGDPREVTAHLRALAPGVTVVGYGQALEIYKDVGDPLAICVGYGLDRAAGYQGVGHTRMATESAVTTEHSHPFAPDTDLTLVHNGSFSNHASIRRRLADQGITFATDNDSEVAACYIGHRIRQGDDLGDALRMVLKEFDGFFTLLVATRTQFAVVRDAFACKPAVLAETSDYVAMASEYHALAGLPGIETARVFEPMPEEVHVWSR